MQSAAFSPTLYWVDEVLYETICYKDTSADFIITWSDGVVTSVGGRLYFNAPEKRKIRIDNRHILLKDLKENVYYLTVLRNFLSFASKA